MYAQTSIESVCHTYSATAAQISNSKVRCLPKGYPKKKLSARGRAPYSNASYQSSPSQNHQILIVALFRRLISPSSFVCPPRS